MVRALSGVVLGNKLLFQSIINFTFAIFVISSIEIFGEGLTFSIYVISLTLIITFFFCLNKQYSIFVLFLISYVLLFYLYPLTEVFLSFNNNYTSEIKVLYTQICVPSVHIAISTYLILFKKSNKRFKLILDDASLTKTYYFFLIISLVAAVVMYFSIGGLKAAQLTRVDLKYVSGGKGYALWLIYFSSVFYFLLPIYFKIKNKNIIYITIVSVFLVFIEYIYFLGLRNRTIPIMHLTSIALSLYLSKFFISYRLSSDESKLKFKKLKTARLLIVLVGLGILGIFIRFARGILLEGEGEFEMSLSDMLILSVERGDLGYTTIVYDILVYVDSHNIILNGQSYLRLLATFIPSAIWPDKPPTTQSLIGQWLTGVDVMTIPPSVFGDAYINFGYVGYTVFAIYGLIFSQLDNIKNQFMRMGLFSITFVLIFHFTRGAFVNPIVSFVFVFFGLFLAHKMLNIRRIEI